MGTCTNSAVTVPSTEMGILFPSFHSLVSHMCWPCCCRKSCIPIITTFAQEVANIISQKSRMAKWDVLASSRKRSPLLYCLRYCWWCEWTAMYPLWITGNRWNTGEDLLFLRKLHRMTMHGMEPISRTRKIVLNEDNDDLNISKPRSHSYTLLNAQACQGTSWMDDGIRSCLTLSCHYMQERESTYCKTWYNSHLGRLGSDICRIITQVVDVWSLYSYTWIGGYYRRYLQATPVSLPNGRVCSCVTIFCLRIHPLSMCFCPCARKGGHYHKSVRWSGIDSLFRKDIHSSQKTYLTPMSSTEQLGSGWSSETNNFSGAR